VRYLNLDHNKSAIKIMVTRNIKDFNFVFGCAPFGYLYFISFQLNEPGLGAGIDPGIALTLFPSSIGLPTCLMTTTKLAIQL